MPHRNDPIEKITEVADEIWEALQNNNVHAVNDSASGSSHLSNDSGQFSRQPKTYENLERQINELKGMTSELRVDRGRSRDQSRNQNRDRSRNRSQSQNRRFNNQGRLCWYHFRFGDQARLDARLHVHTRRLLILIQILQLILITQTRLFHCCGSKHWNVKY